MKKLFFLFFCAIAANMASAQFTVFSNPAYLPDIHNDSAYITAEVFAPGQFLYFPKIKMEGTSNWISGDTLAANGTGTIGAELTNLVGSKKYYYEFTIIDTVAGLSETSSDGYDFTTEPDPAQTQIMNWTITQNATTATFDVYLNSIGHTDSLYVEYGPTSGAGFPYKTSSTLVTGASQHILLTAYGLLPHNAYRARVRATVVGNIPGLQPVITQQKLFTTDSLSSVEATSLAVSVNWQDSVRVAGLVTLGSPSQAAYKVELLTAGLQVADSTPFKTVNANTAFTEMLHGTVPAGDYVIRLVVKDAIGKDTLIISHTAAQVPLPTAALLPIVVSKHNGTLTVSATSNGSSNWPGSQTTIKVEWGAVSQGGLSQYADSSTGIIAQTSHNFTLGTFPASTLVAYKVTVYNGAGVGFTYTGSFTTSAPFALASGSINQNWNGSGAVGFTDWSYATATGDTALVTIEELLPGTTTVVDTMVAGYFTGSGIASDTFSGRTPGTTRDYRLKLRNTDGIISYSNVVVITTQDPNVPEFLVVVDSSYYFADIRVMGDGGGYNNSLNVEITHQGTVEYEVSGMPIQNGPIDQLLHVAPLVPGTMYHAKVLVSNAFYGDFSKEFDFFTKYDATGFRDLAGGDGPKNYSIYNDNILNPELLGICKECTKDDLRIEYQKYAGQKIFVKPEGGSGYQVYIGK